jgi:hypothetical protein
MTFSHLPFRAPLSAYEDQARALEQAWREGHPEALLWIGSRLPRFRDEAVPWLPKGVSLEEIRQAPLTAADMRMTIARAYDFRDWAALEEYATAVARDGPVARYEAAVEAVTAGDAATLDRLLQEDWGLAHARSSRITCFNPPEHRATLLHYLVANGVETYRQKTPANAVFIADRLLHAGADPNALANLYGGECSVLSMLVSSSHPAKAGVQVALLDLLVDRGAFLEPSGSGPWASPLMTALTFGYQEAAEALVRRGAQVQGLDAAAGLGRLADAERLLAQASSEERHRALALAAQNGHVAVTRLLLEAGEDPNHYNPIGCHDHATPLHHAAWNGHLEVVRLLVEWGARLDLRDRIHKSTPLGWAEYAGRVEVAAYLRSQGSA